MIDHHFDSTSRSSPRTLSEFIYQSTSPNDSRPNVRLLKKDLTLGIGAALAISLVIVFLVLAGRVTELSPSLDGGDTESWERWGLHMEVPAGIAANYEGLFEQEASERSGSVRWIWDRSERSLLVTWFESNVAFDYEEAIGRELRELQNSRDLTDFQITGQGDVPIGEHPWRYQSFAYREGGKELYGIIAVSFYEQEKSGYMMSYGSVNPDPFSEMMRFASTFRNS